ncbi:MAG: WYL domain-containing protein [Myxococcota bacterium]
MRRLERLHAIVDFLRARSTAVTVSELAARFDVSERTLFRDLRVLREGDVPLESDPGPMGGVRLGRSYHLPPIGIAIDEAIALWIAVQLAEASTQPRLASTLDKVVGSVPEPRRRAFRAVIERIVIGPEAPANIPDPGPPDPTIYRLCERALVDARVLQLDYADRKGTRTRRVVEPHGLLLLPPVWYLLTHDRDREATRTFRLDRIEAVQALAESFDPIDPRRLFPCDAE